MCPERLFYETLGTGFSTRRVENQRRPIRNYDCVEGEKWGPRGLISRTPRVSWFGAAEGLLEEIDVSLPGFPVETRSPRRLALRCLGLSELSIGAG